MYAIYWCMALYFWNDLALVGLRNFFAVYIFKLILNISQIIKNGA